MYKRSQWLEIKAHDQEVSFLITLDNLPAVAAHVDVYFTAHGIIDLRETVKKLITLLCGARETKLVCIVFLLVYALNGLVCNQFYSLIHVSVRY